LWAPWLLSPRDAGEAYARWISSFADYSVALSRMANNMMHAAMETTRISANYAKDNVRELSRVTGNFARTTARNAREKEDRVREETR
jgi:hypothetical protein